LILACVMGVGRFAYTPLLPAMQAQFQLSTSQAGWVAAANFVGYLIGALMAGRAWVAVRAVPVAIVAVILSVVTTALMAVPGGVLYWAAVRGLSGVASAFAMVCMSAVVLRYLVGQGRSDLAALPYIGVGSAIAASAVLAYVSHDLAGNAGLWLGQAGLALLAGAIGVWWLAQIPAPVHAGDAGAGSDVAGVAATGLGGGAQAVAVTVAARRALAWLVAGYAALGFGYVVTATFLVVIVRSMGEGPWLETAAWVVTGLAAVFSNRAWHRLAARLGVYQVLMIQHGLLAAGVLLPVLHQSVWAALLGGALLGATFMSATGLVLSEGRQLLRADPQKAIGALTAGFGFGQMLGPAVAALWSWTVTSSASVPSTQGANELIGPSWIAAAVLLLGAGAIGRAALLAQKQ
jgi:predicted MFS family arabinose efflux permease